MGAASGASDGAPVLAITEADARLVDATRSLLGRLFELSRGPVEKDALHLAAALGRVLADGGGSPSLAATILEPAIAGPGALGLMRAALYEAYTAGRREADQREAARAWEHPKCVVPLDATTFAVCAGFPDPDPTEVADWADRVAAGLLRAGARHARLAGEGVALACLEDALGLAGIGHSTSQPAPRHFRLPWNR